MTSPEGSPIAAPERAVALDGLRGIALFGVLTVNLLTLFRVSLFDQFLPAAGQTRPLAGASSCDHLVGRIVTIGLEFKAVTLFSLLFGIGLAVQHERARERGSSFATYVTRRLSFLLVLGLLHLFLVWNGDILTLYAVVGALSALALRLPTRALLVLALALFVVQVLPLPYPSPFASYADLRHHVEEARRVYGYGSFREALAFRVHEVRPVAALLLWISPRTLGLFVLGICTWRAGILRGERKGLVRAVAGIGLGGGAAATLLGLSGVDLGRWRDALGSLTTLLLAFGYGALVLLGFGRPAIARVLALFAPVGRMALTSYLTQSLVLSAIFYGWGLGLFGQLGEARAAAIGVVIFAAQAVASALWLARYRFGPVEWLSRSFTYGKLQPMRR